MKRKRDSIPALVLEVIARVYEVAERRTQPWYIDRAALDLGHASESVDSSIYYAEVSGWLVGAGEPPKSVAVTADGVRLLGGVRVYLRHGPQSRPGPAPGVLCPIFMEGAVTKWPPAGACSACGIRANCERDSERSLRSLMNREPMSHYASCGQLWFSR